jgi:hypothetical protein
MLEQIEICRIVIETVEAIAPFHIYPRGSSSLKPGEIDFDWQGQIAYFCDHNAKPTQQIADIIAVKFSAALKRRVHQYKYPRGPRS